MTRFRCVVVRVLTIIKGFKALLQIQFFSFDGPDPQIKLEHDNQGISLANLPGFTQATQVMRLIEHIPMHPITFNTHATIDSNRSKPS